MKSLWVKTFDFLSWYMIAIYLGTIMYLFELLEYFRGIALLYTNEQIKEIL